MISVNGVIVLSFLYKKHLLFYDQPFTVVYFPQMGLGLMHQGLFF